MASAADVSAFLEDLAELPIQTDGDGRIFVEVHAVATTYRLTTYDAAYLELARRRQLPLASLDKDLVAAGKLIGVPLF